MIRRTMLVVGLAAAALAAEPVYVTPAGTTYHKSVKCSAMARSRVVLTGDRAAADKAGVRACGRTMCWPKFKTSQLGGGKNHSWAKQVQEDMVNGPKQESR
jgi:hypothetical protein